MHIRKALQDEIDAIYRMGFDAWNDGESLETYLNACEHSLKYQKGCWYVLVDPSGRICSSLICYSLSEGVCGIGSISTHPELRKRGYASDLVTKVLQLLKESGSSAVFLFSDIDPNFYKRLGFTELPRQHQHYKHSICMVWGISVSVIERDDQFKTPEYF